MDNKSYYSILSKIELLAKTDKLIQDMNAVEEETYGIDFTKPYEMRKRKLIKELLIEMIEAELRFKQFRNLYQKIFRYLEKKENDVIIPNDFQKDVNRAEMFLSI